MKILTTSFKSKHPKTCSYGGLGQLLLEWQQLCLNYEKNIGYGALWDLLFFLFVSFFFLLFVSVKFVCIAVKFVCIYFALHVTFFVSILQEINLIKILSWKFSILIVFFNIIRCYMLFDCFCSFTKTCLRVKKILYFLEGTSKKENITKSWSTA